MKKTINAVITAEAIEPKSNSVQEIDKRLSELSRLYLERFKAMRTGTPGQVQKITDRINVLKEQLIPL